MRSTLFFVLLGLVACGGGNGDGGAEASVANTEIDTPIANGDTATALELFIGVPSHPPLEGGQLGLEGVGVR